jgi:hypothetical protein
MPSRKVDPLVDRDMLEGVIAAVKADPARHLDASQELYLKTRWAGMVMWWHSRSVSARRKYMLLRFVVVVGGVLIPVLATFAMLPDWHAVATILTAVVGAVVAAAAAWEGVTNHGEVWREKRRAAELLKVEGWQFLQLSGKYQADGDLKIAFPRFVNEVETMIANEVGEYLKRFDPSVAKAQDAAAEVLAAIAAEAKKRIASA